MDVATLLNTDMLELLGLQDLPPAKRESLLSEMGQIVQERIIDRVIEAMSADQRQEFDRLLGANAKPEAVDAFIRQAVPGVDRIAAEEVLHFKSTMAEDMATVRKIAHA